MRVVAPIWSASSAAGGRVAAILVATFIALATWSSTAFATTDWFFPTGTLPAGFGFESTGLHSVKYIQGFSSFNGFCVAKDSGGPGWDFAIRVVSGVRACATSGGFAARLENGNCCYRGWIDNQTTVDMSILSGFTYYSY